eukprot:496484-Rhodomonas_salina.2
MSVHAIVAESEASVEPLSLGRSEGGQRSGHERHLFNRHEFAFMTDLVVVGVMPRNAATSAAIKARQESSAVLSMMRGLLKRIKEEEELQTGRNEKGERRGRSNSAERRPRPVGARKNCVTTLRTFFYKGFNYVNLI